MKTFEISVNSGSSCKSCGKETDRERAEVSFKPVSGEIVREGD